MMLSILLRASFEGALLAAAVWIICRALPRLSPAVRALLWWCVAAKFVVSLVWHTPINLPLLPAERGAAPASSSVTVLSSSPVLRESPAPTAIPSTNFSFTTALLAIWALGAAVSLVRVLQAWRDTRGVVQRSTPGHASLHGVVRELSAQLGVTRPADVRVSREIESPLITGLRSAVILVPAERFASLTTDQQRMALCHELAHMKRGDVWLGLIPALVERCFFFHPLARLAAREYAFWREAACDEAVIATLGASPQSYGRLLLALGVARQPATFAAAGAAWSFSNLKRRITMLGSSSSPSFGGRVLAAGAVAFTMLAVAPVKAVARSAHAPASKAVEAVATMPIPVFAPVASELAEAPAPMQDRQTREQRERERRAQEERERVEEVRARLQEERARLQEERARVQEERARIERSERTRERDSRTAAERVRERAQERRSSDEQNFVYITGDEQVMMSGGRGDAARARQFRRGSEPMLWFRRDGQEYVIRDRALLREVSDLWEPVGRIGAQQGEIGAKQGAIGREQGQYGAKQGEIGARQGVIGARQGVVAAQLGLLAARESQGLSAAERRDIARERETLDRDMRALNKEMEALGTQMRAASPPRRDLSDEMSALGREMSVLGEQMGAASRRANSGMQALIDRAIRSGAAEAVR